MCVTSNGALVFLFIFFSHRPRSSLGITHASSFHLDSILRLSPSSSPPRAARPSVVHAPPFPPVCHPSTCLPWRYARGALAHTRARVRTCILRPHCHTLSRVSHTHTLIHARPLPYPRLPGPFLSFAPFAGAANRIVFSLPISPLVAHVPDSPSRSRSRSILTRCPDAEFDSVDSDTHDPARTHSPIFVSLRQPHPHSKPVARASATNCVILLVRCSSCFD